MSKRKISSTRCSASAVRHEIKLEERKKCYSGARESKSKVMTRLKKFLRV